MQEIRDSSEILHHISTEYKRKNRHDGIVDIIGDGLKTEVKFMAEQTTQNQNTEQTTPNYDEIFNKLDAILDKRSEGLAKSALKDNGIDETEIADIVKAYREQKQTKANEQNEALTTAQNRVAELEKQISDKAVDDALSTAALELGIDAKQLPYVSRLANKDDLLGSDGKPDAEKVKAAINKVLEDVPALKTSANINNGFQLVGSKSGDSAGSGEDAEKKLRSYFGLK
jgi:transposase-like protein